MTDHNIPSRIREILACPRCRGALQDDRDQNSGSLALVCPACRLRYPVESGIPILLSERAEPMAE